MLLNQTKPILFNTNISLQHYSFLRTQLNGFMYWDVIQFNISFVIWLHTTKCSNSSLEPKDEILSGTTTGIIDNEGVLHIPQSSRTGASPSNGLMSYPGYLLSGALPFCSHSQLS